MTAHITQVSGHLGGDAAAVYAGFDGPNAWLTVGPVILHANQATPEVLEALAQAATQLAVRRRSQLAPKVVA